MKLMLEKHKIIDGLDAEETHRRKIKKEMPEEMIHVSVEILPRAH